MSKFATILFSLICICVSFRSIAQQDARPYALVAGGSKGIGFAISEALAKRGYNLVLIARNWDGLVIAKDRLQSQYQVRVEILSHDLSKETSAAEIATWCRERQLPLKVLCNVAGMGGTRDYLSLPVDSLRYMVNLNVESCITLSMLLLPLLEQNAPSYILNVASMAAYAPIPDKNMYAATKSAVLFFSYALRYQLKDKDISVSCLTPGPVFTKQSIIDDTRKNLGWIGMQMAVPPAKVGEKAIQKTLRGKMTITPGFLASISARVIRIMPKRVVTAFYNQAGKRNRRQTISQEAVSNRTPSEGE
jgi:short-subunit dehydrogenase